MNRLLVACVVLFSAVASTAAHGEPWHEGPRGHHRVVHLTTAAAAGVAYLTSETLLKSHLAPASCRWCEPPGLDRDVRNNLVWAHPDRAALASNLTGYVAAPLVALGLTALDDRDGDATWGSWLDHSLPIIETVAYSQLFVQAVKFPVGRARPEVAFGTKTSPPTSDDNLSFFSGHSALTFGLAVSAGMVAHQRHSRYEKAIWIAGLTLATSTAYLRIGADKHYLTDVVTGSAVGIAAGAIIPGLVAPSDSGVIVVPTGNGLAISGAF